MQARYGYQIKGKEFLKNVGMSCEPMNTQTAEKWYKETNVPVNGTFFIDCGHVEEYEVPDKTIFGLIVLTWKVATRTVWQRIYTRKNVSYQ